MHANPTGHTEALPLTGREERGLKIIFASRSQAWRVVTLHHTNSMIRQEQRLHTRESGGKIASRIIAARPFPLMIASLSSASSRARSRPVTNQALSMAIVSNVVRSDEDREFRFRESARSSLRIGSSLRRCSRWAARLPLPKRPPCRDQIHVLSRDPSCTRVDSRRQRCRT